MVEKAVVNACETHQEESDLAEEEKVDGCPQHSHLSPSSCNSALQQPDPPVVYQSGNPALQPGWIQ